MREAAAAHGGVEVDTQGDAFFIAFPTPGGAAEAARAAREGPRGGSDPRAHGPAHGHSDRDGGGLRRRGRPPRSAHRGARARRPDPRVAGHGGAPRRGAAPRPRAAPAQGLRRRGSHLPARRARVPPAAHAGERRAPDSGDAVPRPRAGAVRRGLARVRARPACPHDRRPGRNGQDALLDRARAPARRRRRRRNGLRSARTAPRRGVRPAGGGRPARRLVPGSRGDRGPRRRAPDPPRLRQPRASPARRGPAAGRARGRRSRAEAVRDEPRGAA